MPSWYTIAIALCLIMALALIAGSPAAQSKQVKVCAEITLPEKGKCVTKTIHGYKVRVCG